MGLVDAETAGHAKARPAVFARYRKSATIALFLPAIGFYLVFFIVPVVQSIHYSVYAWNGLGPLSDFVGLDNYHELFGDSVFQQALTHNVILVALSLILQLPLALGVALLLNRKFKGRSVLRVVFFAPYVLSEAITAVDLPPASEPAGPLDAWLKCNRARQPRPSSGWQTSISSSTRSSWSSPGSTSGSRSSSSWPGSQGVPAGDHGGRGRRRRRLGLEDARLRDDAAARTDAPDLGVPHHHRVATALRASSGS